MPTEPALCGIANRQLVYSTDHEGQISSARVDRSEEALWGRGLLH
jgi:hypothetical protein